MKISESPCSLETHQTWRPGLKFPVGQLSSRGQSFLLSDLAHASYHPSCTWPLWSSEFVISNPGWLLGSLSPPDLVTKQQVYFGVKAKAPRFVCPEITMLCEPAACAFSQIVRSVLCVLFCFNFWANWSLHPTYYFAQLGICGSV